MTKKVIPDGRPVKLLSDAASLMPERIKQEANLVEQILGISYENVESVLALINEANFMKACEIIKHAIKIRPLNIPNLLNLLSRISSKFNAGKLERSIKRENKVLTEFGEGSIEQAIIEDNVEQFCQLISSPSFNAKRKVNFKSVKENDESLLSRCESYMHLIAFSGAVNCFRQIKDNKNFDLYLIAKYAIAGGSVEIASILKEKGISFYRSFEIGVVHHRMDMCDWLLMNSQCESVSLSIAQDCYNYPAFYFIMENEKSFDEAIITAAMKGNLDLIKCLIEDNHTDHEAKDSNEKTPLHIASERGYLEVVRYLIEQCNANIEAKDNKGMAPIHYASEKGHINILKYLIEEHHANIEMETTSGWTPLNVAAFRGKFSVLKYLIKERHANIETKNDHGWTLLHSASFKDQIEPVIYIIKECQASVNNKDANGRTPLHIASSNGNIMVVQYLIEACNADAEATDNDGRTPLYDASYNGRLKVVKYLVEERHVDPSKADINGKTPYDVALDSPTKDYLKRV